MRRSETIAILSLAVIGAAALGLGRYVATEIETRVGAEARQALDDLGFAEVMVLADGALVELSGSVRSEREREIIVENLETLPGAPELVDNLVVVATFIDLQPSILQVQKDGTSMTLSGSSPNVEARDLLGARAQISAESGNVLNLMDVQDRRADDDWLRAAEAVIDAVGDLRAGRAVVEPGLVRVNGAALNAERKAEIETALRAAIDSSFRLEMDIASPPPFLSPYVFAARKGGTGFAVTTCAAPDSAQRSLILGALRARDYLPDDRRADLCVIANGAPNTEWAVAVERAIDVLGPLLEGEVRIIDDRIEVLGYVEEGGDAAAAAAVARANWPATYQVSVDVSEVLPIVTPFTLTAVKQPGEVRLSGFAPTRERSDAWASLLDATNTLEVARGAPEDWAEAATLIIEALAEMRVGAATLADRTFRLAAPGDATERARLEARLRAALPPGYRLTVVEAAAPDRMEEDRDETPVLAGPVDTSTYLFEAQRLPDGSVIIRGVVADDTSRAVVSAYAKAQLGSADVDEMIEVGEGRAPDGWQRAIFAGLEALGEIDTGDLAVETGAIFVIGASQAAADARRAGAALAEKTPDGFTRFSRIEIVETRPKTEEELAGPALSPQECISELNQVVQSDPVVFASGSAEISDDSAAVLDQLAAILLRCPAVQVEIGGHTDSLGSEEVNAQLSQQRAEAVWGALVGRRVARDRLASEGYGPSQPVATNDTEEGRLLNRRIEFKLLGEAE